MMDGHFNIVIGGQAGSEAKGKLSGYLAAKYRPEIIAGCLAPNAGHTIIDGDKKYVSHHIPVCSVMSPESMIVMGPASVINLAKFTKELDDLEIDRSRLLISPRAAVITQEMVRAEEQTMTVIGSTAQGVGLARVAKLMRYEDAVFFEDLSDLKLYEMGISRAQIVDTSRCMNMVLNNGETILYEMSQGFDLCLEHGIDRRYCTSRVINPAAAFAESGINMRDYCGEVYGVIRPYPIRVNNRSGYSGPYAEAKEITWAEIARRCGAPKDMDLTETTTTTKLPRRVFEFSWERYKKFIEICRPEYLCLQFANYIDWGCYGMMDNMGMPRKVCEFVAELEKESEYSTVVRYIGTGPDHSHMVEL